MALTLYSLRSEIDKDGQSVFRITKFADGDVESSYLTSRDACACPAGQRPTCRHRQMLPAMLNADIVNTHWFMNWDHGGSIVDFEGTTRATYLRAEGEALRQAEAIPQPEPEGLLVPTPLRVEQSLNPGFRRRI